MLFQGTIQKVSDGRPSDQPKTRFFPRCTTLVIIYNFRTLTGADSPLGQTRIGLAITHKTDSAFSRTEPVDEVAMNKGWMSTLGNVYEQQRKDFPHGAEIDGLKSIEETKKIIQHAVKKIMKK
ncbi:hypothetical protein HYX14_06305 [Candidatus Woesearchaeota archaeon]|nr:hypothetical protein [Candidatus Woesearchaeota archaeon]